jgi:hypothetical protein
METSIELRTDNDTLHSSLIDSISYASYTYYLASTLIISKTASCKKDSSRMWMEKVSLFTSINVKIHKYEVLRNRCFIEIANDEGSRRYSKPGLWLENP